MLKNDIYDKLGGISGKNRELLNILYKEAKGPFNSAFVTKVLNVKKLKAKNLLNAWVKRNWLVRIRKGLYSIVPLGGMRPDAGREDTWVVAQAVFSPCYIGGWSACEYWGFTEQIFNNIIVYTTKRIDAAKKTIQGANYLIKFIKKDKYFGLKPVWKDQIKIMVSDPARTVIDLLNDPKSGGGIRNVILMVKEYFSSKERNDNSLVEYLSKFGNRTIYKRLGYIIEISKIDASSVLETCERNISSGFSKLDPSLAKKGRTIKKWNLIINSSLRGVIDDQLR